MKSCRSCCFGRRAALISGCVGCVICVVFGILFYFIPDIINSMIYLILPVSPGSFAYTFWHKIPFKMYRQFYLFNYTNADEFDKWGKNGVRPIVEQIGPYTYIEQREKIFLDWNEPPYVTYRERHTFYFQPDMSSGAEDDLVVFPNPVAIVQLNSNCKMQHLLNGIMPPEIRDIWALAMNVFLGTPLLPEFQTAHVGNLLFYGYHDELVDIAQDVLKFEIFPDGVVGLMYGKNGTDDGKYKMNRGTEDHSKMYHITEWNGNSSVNLYDNKYCDMINGSDGTMYPVGLKQDSRVYIFVSNVKRSLYLNYTNQMTFQGIDGYGFSPPLDFYGDINTNPDNHCFCFDNHNLSFASGVIYVGPIFFNTSIYMSNPYFLGADFRLVDAIDGMKPNAEEHTFKINVHPELGVPLSGGIRIQGSLLMQPYDYIKSTHNWPTIMLPILWLNESCELDDATVDDINQLYYGGQKLVYSLVIIVIIISGMVSASGIACAYKQAYSYKKSLKEMTNESFVFEEEAENKSEKNYSS